MVKDNVPKYSKRYRTIIKSCMIHTLKKIRCKTMITFSDTMIKIIASIKKSID